MCLLPYVCFSPHFHESGNEHLSLLPTCLNIRGHATFLLSSFLTRIVSSSVFHSKNVGCLNLLWSATVAVTSKGSLWPWELPHKPWQPVFPHLESLAACLQPACSPCGKDSLCSYFVGLFWADFGSLSAKAVWGITFSKEAGWERCIHLFLDGCTLAHSVLVHKHSHACRQPAGWHRQSCIML